MKVTEKAWQISACRSLMFGFGLALATLALPSVASAQYNRANPQQPAPVMQELHGKGEFEAAGGGMIKAVLDGKPWLLKADKTFTAKVMGTATADFLAPGMFVRFKADLDKRYKASTPVAELEIFTPDSKNIVGATTAGGAFAEAPKKGPGSAAPTPYTVAGRITSMHKGSMNVNCGSITVKADVAPEAAIKIEVSDPTWADPGDKIEVKGHFLHEGYGIITDLAVDKPNPLTGPRKKTAAHPAKTTDKTTDKTADKSDKGNKADSAFPSDKKPDPKKGSDPTDAKKPAAGDAKPDTTKPDTTKPDAKPDAGDPDAKKPDAVKPDATKPDAAKPDAKPAAAATDTK